MHWSKTKNREETIQKIRAVHVGRKQSLSERAMRSQLHKDLFASGKRVVTQKMKDAIIARNKSPENREKVRQAQLGVPRPQTTGKLNYAWKGNKVSYSGLHKWIYRKLGQKKECQNKACEKLPTLRFEWANVNGKYKRNLKDWIRLCVFCHRRWDKQDIVPTIQ